MSTIASADVQGLAKLQNGMQTVVLIVVSIVTSPPVFEINNIDRGQAADLP